MKMAKINKMLNKINCDGDLELEQSESKFKGKLMHKKTVRLS